jgi:guanylate kinase
MTTALKEVEARSEFDYEVINAEREQARKDIIRTMRNIVEGGKDAERA